MIDQYQEIRPASGSFLFRAVPNIQITPDAAAAILSDPDPGQAFREWVHSNQPSMLFNSTGCELANMKSALGNYLAELKVAEAKQLSLPV